MTPSYESIADLALALQQHAIATADSDGENRLLLPLLRWLVESRRINAETRIALELPWLGRRVDLATLTSTRRAAAYELKLGSLGRALEQATYNRSVFDRSYVVTSSMPRPENLALAAEHGIGVILVRDRQVRRILESPALPPTPELRTRLLSKFTSLRAAGGV
ncbi:MAG: hypothetical protein JWO74_1595 [Solirubrobacterales bacterium]|nr:hypothetical protein [Solirubrobacterales bacterium]